MQLFSLLSAATLAATGSAQTFRADSAGSGTHLTSNKDIAHHTQWRPSQKSARNSVNYIFDLQFNTRDDGSFCSNGYTGNSCTERVCAYGLSSATSAFLSAGDGAHTPGNGGVQWGGGGSYGGTHSYTECSSQGVCDRLTGECACFAGYQGKGCRRTTCPNECSGHGTCLKNSEINSQYQGHRAGDEESQSFSTQFWDHAKTMQCNCDRGFTGHDCSERICPHGDDVLTSCSEDSNKDQQIIRMTNVITAQDLSSPFLTCGGSSTSAQSGLQTIEENGSGNSVRAEFNPFFAIQFSDSLGGTYTTTPIAIQVFETTPQACVDTNGDATGATRANCDFNNGDTWMGTDPDSLPEMEHAAATAKAVQRALEALPNHAIPSVQVEGTTTAGGAGDRMATSDLEISHNSAYTTANALVTADAVDANTADGTAAAVAVDCSMKDFELVVIFSDDATSGKQNLLQIVSPSSDSDCESGMQPRMPTTFWDEQSPVDVATGDDKSLRIWVVDNDAETGMGTHEENAECGNRGLCDTNTGKCSCFSGHTGEACGIQSNFV